MIEYILRGIPSRNVSLDDFPYLNEYFEYATNKILKTIDSEKISRPNLVIKDTPYLESHFLDLNGDGFIVFDIGASLLLSEITPFILSGELTGEAWISLLETSANSLTSMGYPHIGVSFAFNRAWNLATQSPDIDKKPLIKFTNDFSNEEKNIKRRIYCQEMFILAHEITHYFIGKDIYESKNLEKILREHIFEEDGRTLLKDFLEIFSNDSEVSEEKNENILDEISRELASESLKEEIICDLQAALITIDYFTWDEGAMHIEDVCAAIRIAMTSIILTRSLKNHIQSTVETHKINQKCEHQIDLHIVFREIIMERFLSRLVVDQPIITSGKIERISKYSLVLPVHLEERFDFLENFVFREIEKMLAKLEKSYYLISPYIKYPETSAFYYQGYKNSQTVREEFMGTDGSIFMRNPEIAKYLFENAKVDIYQLDTYSKKDN